MVLEIVASRLVAPFVGVSLYTWTSVIGLVLLGLSAGNLVGGWLADRYRQEGLLGLLLLGASLLTSLVVVILPFSRSLSSLTPSLPVNILILVGVLFLFPSFVFGTILPVATRLFLEKIATSGQRVGLIYAASSLGSILGVFAAGFYLISHFGSTTVLLLVSSLLVVTALMVQAKLSPFFYLAVALWLALVVWISVHFGWKAVFSTESNYYTIRVVEDEVEEGKKRYLLLDTDTHGEMFLPQGEMAPPYMWAAMVSLGLVYPQKALFLGGGAYLLPSFLAKIRPETSITVVEIDPEVTAVARDYFGVHPRLLTINADARPFFPREEKYDLIVNDTFSSHYSVPWQLTTQEFLRQVKSALTANGVYVTNIISSVEGEKSLFYQAYLATLATVFEPIWVISLDEPENLQNIVVFSFKGNPQLAPENIPEESRQYLASINKNPKYSLNLVLTDNFAPVENLMLPALAPVSP